MVRIDNEPKYVISIAARLIGCETHTLRYYERIGLVRPQRSKGRIRYYSEDEVSTLRLIRTLVEDLGVNPAGVEVVLRLAREIADLKRRLGEAEARVRLLEEYGQE
jgi:MerR family transcriptional regulator/heat shock protein HspR